MDEEIKQPEDNKQSSFEDGNFGRAENSRVSPKASEDNFAEIEKQRDEYLNNWKRAAADLINYKKEEMERMAMLGNYVKEDMILKILPVLDSIYLAEKKLPENLKMKAREPQINGLASSPQVEWTKGFLQIQQQIAEFLKKEGIEAIVTVGQKFNPEIMESVGEVEKGESGTVAEELQKGYIMDSKVLRPAKVRITK